jgi:hypothetical protein
LVRTIILDFFPDKIGHKRVEIGGASLTEETFALSEGFFT